MTFARFVELFYDDGSGGGADWHDITADVDDAVPISTQRGAQDEESAFMARPGRLKLRLHNGRSFVNDQVTGRYTVSNPLSDLYGLLTLNLPIRVRVDLDGNTSTRFVGQMLPPKPRQDHAGGRNWADVEAAGILRQLGIQASPLRPATERFARQTGAVAFWPMDDPAGTLRARPTIGTSTLNVDATRVIAAIDGDIPLLPRWDAGALAPWAGTGAEFERFRGQITEDPDTFVNNSPNVTARIGIRNATAFTVAFLIRGNPTMTPAGVVIRIRGELRLAVAALDGTAQTISVVLVDDAGATVEDFGSFSVPELWAGDGTLRVLQITGSNVGGILEWLLHVDGVLVAGSSATSSGESITVLGDLLINAPVSPPGTLVLIRDFGVWDTNVDPADLYAAYTGHIGETAGRRVERICSEQGVPFTSVGDLDASAPLGPQYPETFLAIVGDAAKVEAGGAAAPILGEQRTANGLHFRILASMYNLDPAVEWSYTAGDLAEQPQPIPDDQRTVNDATARRRDGGEARIVQQDGPRGVEVAGRYDRAEDFGTLSDSLMVGIARWWALHGTQDGDRFPGIAQDVRPLPDAQIPDALALDIGQRLSATDLDRELVGQGRLDQLTLGVTEVLRKTSMRQQWHTTPIAPFTVPVLEDDEVGVLQSDSATVDEPLDTTETAVDIDAGAGPDWVHDGVDYDIQFGGEVVTVTAVGAMSGTFPNRKVTLTVTRSVNGIVKSHATGAKIKWATKAYIGLWG